MGGHTGMAFAQTFSTRIVAGCAAVMAAVLVVAAPGAAQANKPAPASAPAPARAKTQAPSAAAAPAPAPTVAPADAEKQAEMPWDQELKKYPGLVQEIGPLVAKLKAVHMPPPRTESKILPLLPEATMGYAAFPNYGDAIHQAVVVFRAQLAERPVLRDWWEHGAASVYGPKVLDGMEKIYEVSQHVGDEIVVAGGKGEKDISLLAIAEVKQPGLKELLEQVASKTAPVGKPLVRVMDEQELAADKGQTPGQDLAVLVRPDLVVAAQDAATLGTFEARMAANGREFASGPFGQRLRQAYEGGTTIVGGLDLRGILRLIPPKVGLDGPGFQSSGFADVKYLIWNHADVNRKAVNRGELSFTGPRHGIAAWLAKPGPMGGLDYVSPNAMMALTLVLVSPAQMFEDVKGIAAAMHSTAFAAVPAFEQMVSVNLKDDLLGQLGGEITVELDEITPTPKWRAVLRVVDADRFEKAAAKLLALAPYKAEQFEEGGVTYHVLTIPAEKGPVEVGYAFVDGYLVVASGREAVADSVRAHRSGESLWKSKRFLEALPPGRGTEASAMLYQDSARMGAAQTKSLAPGLKEALEQVQGEAVTVSCSYAEESAVRGESNGAGFETMGMGLVVAAIAIPNLLRSRMAANEATAVGSLRTVNTAQVTYAAQYPNRGFARDLATLGPVPEGEGAASAQHADLIDQALGATTCTGGVACEKSGYQFRVTAECKLRVCKDYVVVAVPSAAGQSGSRKFCSTSDGVIRFRTDEAVSGPASAAECKEWAPLQ